MFSQGHLTWYKSEDSMQGNNGAKYKRPSLNSVKEKANVN